MSPSRSSVWKVMTIWISWVLPLFNFERLDILCPRIGHLCEKLWVVEFVESFRCSISSVSIYYVPESHIRVKFYDHSNFSRASIVQFRASRWVMSSNQTSEWNVMTIRICWELPFFNFERLDELCPWIGHLVKSYDHSNFASTSVVQFQASRYIMSPNRSSVWKVRTIRISGQLPLFNYEHLDILCPWVGHPSEILWPFEFLESFRCSISSV